MRTRTITLVVMFALFIPLIIVGGWSMQVAISILAIIGVYEFFLMKKTQFFSIEGLLTSIATLSIVWGYARILVLHTRVSYFYVFFLCTLLLMVCSVYREKYCSFEDAAVYLLASLYVGGGFGSLLYVRSIGTPMVFLVLGVVWATDIFAYLTGRAFGKHKLAPKVSPNKTIEGSIGGIVAAVVYVLVYGHYYNPVGLAWLESAILAVAMSWFGQLGDLVESSFKRHFGVKDSGWIFPGHGGILDRFDSMFFALFVYQIVLGVLGKAAL